MAAHSTTRTRLTRNRRESGTSRPWEFWRTFTTSASEYSGAIRTRPAATCPSLAWVSGVLAVRFTWCRLVRGQIRLLIEWDPFILCPFHPPPSSPHLPRSPNLPHRPLFLFPRPSPSPHLHPVPSPPFSPPPSPPSLPPPPSPPPPSHPLHPFPPTSLSPLPLSPLPPFSPPPFPTNPSSPPHLPLPTIPVPLSPILPSPFPPPPPSHFPSPHRPCSPLPPPHLLPPSLPPHAQSTNGADEDEEDRKSG